MNGATCETLTRLGKCPASTELAAMREENARLREACRAFAAEGISKGCAGEVVAIPIDRLREIEWIDGERGFYCPACRGKTHAPDCRLGNILSAARSPGEATNDARDKEERTAK